MARTYAGIQADIGDGQTINSEVKPYLEALLDAVAVATNVRPTITEGTRTWDRQNYLYVNRFKPGFNSAWPPDRPSVHQLGRALDFGSGAGYAGNPVQVALHTLGPLYGFAFPIKTELWHAEWDAKRAPKVAPASTSQKVIKTIATLVIGEDMIHLKGSSKRGEVALGPGYKHALTGEESTALQGVNMYPIVNATENDKLFDLLVDIHTKPAK